MKGMPKNQMIISYIFFITSYKVMRNWLDYLPLFNFVRFCQATLGFLLCLIAERK